MVSYQIRENKYAHKLPSRYSLLFVDSNDVQVNIYALYSQEKKFQPA